MDSLQRRREWRAAHPVLEFARGVPQGSPVVTYRRGVKWLERAKPGQSVLLVHAHGQPDPQREMRLSSIERFTGRELPPEVAASLSLVYGAIDPDEDFLKLTLED